MGLEDPKFPPGLAGLAQAREAEVSWPTSGADGLRVGKRSEPGCLEGPAPIRSHCQGQRPRLSCPLPACHPPRVPRMLSPFSSLAENCIRPQSNGQGFSGGSDSKESACNAGDPGLIHEWGRSPGGGHGNPLQYSCLENSMGRGAWRATVHGLANGWT